MSKWLATPVGTHGDRSGIKTVEPPSGAHALLVSGVVGTLAVLLAACGGASDPPPAVAPTGKVPIVGPTRTSPPMKDQALTTSQHLCQSVSSLTHLVVSRHDGAPENHIHFSFPATVKVSSAAQVRAAARALCALPAMPTGVFSCPADFGIDYNLTFSTKDRSFPVVKIDATGCEGVSGTGISSRWVARSPGFWSTLGKAMGLKNPTNTTFRGSPPT